jgi:hypothetical protein
VSIAINIGDAFLIDTPPNGQHLYIAIAQTSATHYLLVNMTTRRASSETTCILLPGPEALRFVTRESVIAYQYALEVDGDALARLITLDSPIPKDSCSTALITRIQQGGLVSKRLKNRYKIALKTFLADHPLD